MAETAKTKKASSEARPADPSAHRRPPVVVVLGHVDHGKTTLLDHIRKSNVADKETGGITQHIGAYQISHDGRLVTFLDTPGHEAFSEMRRRGAKVADIAVLVVAADEGIKPQTLEAAKHIADAAIPYVVALNKTDRPGADVMRVKKELSDNGIQVEEWGGKVPAVAVSAKNGEGVGDLLDTLLLMWDVEEGEEMAPIGENARGVVIESRMDPRRGASATVLVTQGVLRRGASLQCGNCVGKARILEDHRGKNLEEASAATPVMLLGLEDVPPLGDVCEEVTDLEKARADLLQRKDAAKTAQRALDAERVPTETTFGAAKSKHLSLVLKGDVLGSVEAIRDALHSVESGGIGIRIVESGAGEVMEADVKKAEATGAVVVAFRAGVPKTIEQFAASRGVRIRSFDLIYECLAGVRKELEVLLPKEIIKHPQGSVALLAVFKKAKDGIIVGGKVAKGKVVRGTLCDLMRGGTVVGEGKIRELKIGKDDVTEAKESQECGMLYVGKGEAPSVGDVIEAYEREERAKIL